MTIAELEQLMKKESYTVVIANATACKSVIDITQRLVGEGYIIRNVFDSPMLTTESEPEYMPRRGIDMMFIHKKRRSGFRTAICLKGKVYHNSLRKKDHDLVKRMIDAGRAQKLLGHEATIMEKPPEGASQYFAMYCLTQKFQVISNVLHMMEKTSDKHYKQLRKGLKNHLQQAYFELMQAKETFERLDSQQTFDDIEARLKGIHSIFYKGELKPF